VLSMTGYGNGEATAGDATVTVELRAVNHRFLDVALKLPSALGFCELDVREILKDRVARGRVSCTLTLERGSAAAGVALQPARVEAGLTALHAMADAVAARGLPRPEVRLEHLLALPGLFDGGQPQDDREALQAAVKAALEQAIAGLEAMKRKEGAETAAEMRARTEAIDRHLGTVTALVPGALEEAQNRLRERLAQLLGDALDPQRLAQEAAILVDKGNINEECERLASHLEQVRDALAEGGQVAKRLNFLFQEMHREVNTMGSKTQNLEITRAVIAMKEEIETLREQVQNLE